jgi:hypothetical protein
MHYSLRQVAVVVAAPKLAPKEEARKKEKAFAS